MTDLAHDALTARLDAVTRTRTALQIRPVDAATLIVMDTKGKYPKILMGRRNDSLKFMPGKYVFPGGRVDAADRSMVAMGMLSPRAEARLMARTPRMTPQRCRALAMAAIRETFEETGLMIGSAEFGAPESAPAGVWSEFAALGLHPTPDALIYVARAITPPSRPRRFDTRFFAAQMSAVGHRIDRDIGLSAELTELAWVTLEDAVKLDLPVITQVIIEELKQRMVRGLGTEQPVPFYFERHRKFLRETV
jgi:8-oxo-dGTP pyrophosphatase MutT (NUDIX family)